MLGARCSICMSSFSAIGHFGFWFLISFFKKKIVINSNYLHK